MFFDNLFIRTRKSLAGIQLDAVVSEQHTNTVTVTDNPVESGVDVTDHSVVQPKVINIVGVVSDSPLGAEAFSQIVDNVTNLFGSATDSNVTRSAAAYRDLVDIQNRRQFIDVQTNLVLYRNMIITNISVTQDKDNSRIVRLNIECREVIISDTEVIQLSPEQLEAGQVRNQGASAVEKGRQEANEASESTNRSVLKAISDWIGIGE